MEYDTPTTRTSTLEDPQPLNSQHQVHTSLAVVSHLKPNKPMRYYGKKDHNVVEGWIASVNSYFALTNAQPPYIYHYLNTIFAGEAAIWFRYHFPESVAVTLTWETVRESLRSFFIPPNKDRRLQDEWARLHQTKTVAEYISRFCTLVMQLPKQEQPMLVDKFIRGLKPKTRMELELKDPHTLDEAFRLADRFDAIVYRQTYDPNNNNYFGKPTPEPRYEDGGEPMQLDALAFKSSKHQGSKLGENQRLQKLTPEERAHLRNIGACYKCRKPGHLARECLSTNKEIRRSENSNRQ
jgi:hypothetical protein